MFELKSKQAEAIFRDSSGQPLVRPIEIRWDPISGLSSRITFSRALETERGLEKLHSPPENDMVKERCPFCPDRINSSTPMLRDSLGLGGRARVNASVLFPNLFPYTEWSAVATFDENHYVEIGTASLPSYRDCLINCSRYLDSVLHIDRDAKFMAISQNHLPAAGGSLIHPHLQVHATRYESNNHRRIKARARQHRSHHGSGLLADFFRFEKASGHRYIGSTGSWEWTAAYAPRGFFELWAAAPGTHSLTGFHDAILWEDLARGILNAQRFYRSMNRNSYNLGILSVEDGSPDPELLVSVKARSSYAPWVRSDITGFEMAFDEMATFSPPEETAASARAFWQG